MCVVGSFRTQSDLFGLLVGHVCYCDFKGAICVAACSRLQCVL